MADTFTTNYTFILVEVGASRDTWGAKENTNLISIDTNLKNLQNQITANVAADTAIRAEYKAWLPVGSIVAWHTGSSGAVPAGWAICDGRVVPRSDGSGDIGTPNLVNRFLLADVTSGSTGGAWSATTEMAGTHSHGDWTAGHVLTIAEMPSHTHAGGFTSLVGITQGSFQQGVNTRTETAATGGNAAHVHQIYADGNHAHTVSIIPQYFTVIFIMRV